MFIFRKVGLSKQCRVTVVPEGCFGWLWDSPMWLCVARLKQDGDENQA